MPCVPGMACKYYYKNMFLKSGTQVIPAMENVEGNYSFFYTIAFSSYEAVCVYDEWTNRQMDGQDE